MSGTLPANPPASEAADSSAIELLLEARPRDLGGFSVRRLLPAAARRLVGPFIFFDHMGPAQLPPGVGMDVRPHPHIALATVTYLFDGEIVHRDSLGSIQTIRPGDINWMVAGRGIAHSERSGDQRRRDGQSIEGIQCWVALPRAAEESQPAFDHHPSDTIPAVQLPGATLNVLAGTAYGQRSPVRVLSPTLYVHGRLEDGAVVPLPDEHEERAVYVVTGAVRCRVGGQAPGEQPGQQERLEMGSMAVFRPGASVELQAEGPTRLMLLGGAPLDGERHVWWNFVSSSRERIDKAAEDWKNGKFPRIPGDDQEFIPLPDR